MRVVLLDVPQEALQQRQPALVAPGDGHRGGASGGRPDRIQVSEAGQVLCGTHGDDVIRSRSEAGLGLNSGVPVPGPGWCRGLCSNHSNPACWAHTWMDRALAPPTSCQTDNTYSSPLLMTVSDWLPEELTGKLTCWEALPPSGYLHQTS